MSPNNPARRRLVFEQIDDGQNPDSPVYQIRTNSYELLTNLARRRPVLEETLNELAKADNSVNILQESIMRDREEKSLVWNFDFTKEEALCGKYEWYKREDDEWVIMEPRIDNACLRYFNESTPYQVRDESAPVVKKRKSNVDGCGSSAKRKIEFE